MPLLQIGAYKPDVSDYESDATKNILNVIPRGDGYGPMASFASATSAIPAACRGAFYALKSDGSVQEFAGTSTGLYRLDNTTLTWIPVTRVTTVTITSASPGVITETAHGGVANDPKVFSNSGGALPAAITAGTVYYIKTVLSADTYTISATAGGTAINTASTGTGTHSVTHVYSALSSDANWQFAQFGSLVFATQKNEPLQVYNLSSSTAFANCAGSPPQASYISVVGRFLVLSGLLSNPFRIHWSGLNDTTNWTSGTGSSDFQDFPDGGIVRGVAGGEFGIIFQDQAIRRMSYVPGSPIIFQIDRITQDMGLFAPYSIIPSGSTIYFYSNKGFYKIAAGGLPEQIGRERVDRTHFTDMDRGNLQLMQGAADPRGTFIFWAYKSGAGATGLFDKVLGYDTALDRFFPLSISGEYLLGISQAGITLENLDSISSSIDALTLTLDAYATSVQPQIAAFNNDHKQGFFTGSNLEATLETGEQGTDENTVTVRGFRPITDATTVFGRVSHRMTQGLAVTNDAEVAISTRTGRIDPQMRDTRYARLRLRIPAAATWTFCAGVVPDIEQSGML
jgi:hypothetical protein